MACTSRGQGPPFPKVQGSLASKSSEAQVKGNLPHPHPHIRKRHPLSPHQKGRTGRTEISAPLPREPGPQSKGNPGHSLASPKRLRHQDCYWMKSTSQHCELLQRHREVPRGWRVGRPGPDLTFNQERSKVEKPGRLQGRVCLQQWPGEKAAGPGRSGQPHGGKSHGRVE